MGGMSLRTHIAHKAGQSQSPARPLVHPVGVTQSQAKPFGINNAMNRARQFCWNNFLCEMMGKGCSLIGESTPTQPIPFPWHTHFLVTSCFDWTIALIILRLRQVVFG